MYKYVYICIDGMEGHTRMEGGSRATHGPSANDAVNDLGLPDGEIILRLSSVCVRSERRARCARLQLLSQLACDALYPRLFYSWHATLSIR
jgi:hypothetical protein